MISGEAAHIMAAALIVDKPAFLLFDYTRPQ